jgi:hypothetical protein
MEATPLASVDGGHNMSLAVVPLLVEKVIHPIQGHSGEGWLEVEMTAHPTKDR